MENDYLMNPECGDALQISDPSRVAIIESAIELMKYRIHTMIKYKDN